MRFVFPFPPLLDLATATATTLMLLSIATPAHAQQVITPNGATTAEANTNNFYPFLIDGGQRYQQVYNALQFSTLSTPRLITQIAFRPDTITGEAFTRTLSNILIRFFTTAAAEDGLFTTFASNLGSNTTTAYSGALMLSSTFTGPVRSQRIRHRYQPADTISLQPGGGKPVARCHQLLPGEQLHLCSL